MAHPHKSQAAESSRSKFAAITGHKGGGHAHAGSSHLKKPGAHGVQKTWSGHHKAHLLEGEHAHGGRTKPRHGYARGGKVRDVNIKIQMPPAQGGAGLPPPPPPAAPPPAPPSPPPGGLPPPPGGPMGGAGGPNPLNAAMGKGLGFKKGGRVAGGQKVKPSVGDTPYDLGHWAHYAEKGTPIKQTDRDKRARGGRMTAGAMSGVGRLEQYEHQRAKAHRRAEGR